MYIKRLELENYRGFQHLVVDFPASAKNLAVFVGINGAGKSSILDALATLLEQLVQELLSANRRSATSRTARVQGIGEGDINVNSNSLTLKVDAVLVVNRESIPWQLSLTRIDYEAEADELDAEESNSETSSPQQNLALPSFHFQLDTDKISDYLNNIKNEQNNYFPSPLLIYYKTHRIVVDSSAYDRYSSGRSYSVYRGALSIRGIRSFEDFFNWFKDQEDIENEKRLRENPEYKLLELEVIRLAITKFLDGFPCSRFQDLRVERTIQETSLGRVLTQPSLTIQKNETRLRLEQLSDGEKNLLMLVLDIARRLAIVNRSEIDVNRSEIENSLKVLEGEGIVLIDEVDLHLHPSWQRAILPALTNTFPNCQFIVTTHSPQVISAIPGESIFILDEGNVTNNPGYTYGRDSNSILRQFMDVPERVRDIQEKLDICLDSIDDNELDQARIHLQELKELLKKGDSSISVDDYPEVIRVSSLINLMEED